MTDDRGDAMRIAALTWPEPDSPDLPVVHQPEFQAEGRAAAAEVAAMIARRENAA